MLSNPPGPSSPFVPALLALLVAYLGTVALRHLLLHWRVVDEPNERSSHRDPVPRGGGLAILAGLAVAAVWAYQAGAALPARWTVLVGGGLAVAAVGLWDDLVPSGVRWWLRLAVHLAAAVWLAAPVGGLQQLPLPAPANLALGPLAVPVAVVWIVAVVNFVNFVDGIDGLAASQIAAVGVALAAALAGGAWIGWVLSGACLGFLVLNWQPARIFMGDVGSGALGFLVAALPFAGDAPSRSGVMLIGATAFLVLADATFTLLRRLLRGERIFEAHRSHLYQRLVLAGYSHAAVAGALACGALLLATLAAGAFRSGTARYWWLCLATGVVGFLFELSWTWRAEARAAAEVPRS